MSRLELKDSFLKKLEDGTAGGRVGRGGDGGAMVLRRASPGPAASRIRKGVGAPMSRGDNNYASRANSRGRMVNGLSRGRVRGGGSSSSMLSARGGGHGRGLRDKGRRQQRH